MDDSTTIMEDDKMRASVKIGLNPSGMFESIEKEQNTSLDKSAIANEYRSAKQAL